MGDVVGEDEAQLGGLVLQNGHPRFQHRGLHFRLEEDQIKGQSRSRDSLNARQIAMYLIRRMTSLSLDDNGKVFSLWKTWGKMLKKEGPCAPVGKSLFGGVDVGDDGLNHLRVAGVCLHLALSLCLFTAVYYFSSPLKKVPRRERKENLT